MTRTAFVPSGSLVGKVRPRAKVRKNGWCYQTPPQAHEDRILAHMKRVEAWEEEHGKEDD